MELKHIVLFLSFSLVFCSSNSRILTNEQIANKIDEYVGGLLQCRKFIGANLAVVKNGSVILTKGYGLANVRRNESVTTNNKFPIASITKSFTALLVMKLLTEKQISIDTKVKDLWSGYTAWSGYRYHDLTLRDFLAHKTGTPRHDFILILGGQNRENVVNKIRFLRPNLSPRIEHQYHNLFYVLSGKIAEVIADNGKDWENLIEDNFFKPIGMENSGFYDKQDNYNGFVSPYVPSSNGTHVNLVEYPADVWRNVGRAGPSGSIVSTAYDMGKWLAMILNRGVALNGKRILTEEAIERVFANEISFNDFIPELLGNKPELGKRTSYGLGFWNGYQSGVEFHQHGGDLTGFHSTHILIRSIKSGFSFSTNHGQQSLERAILENSIHDILMGRDPSISLDEACNSALYENHNSDTTFPNIQNIPKYSELIKIQRFNNNNITKYTGKYDNWAYGSISVKSTGAAIFRLSLDYGNMGRFNLLPTENDTYIGISKPGPSAIIPNMIFHFEDEQHGRMNKLVALSFEILDPPIFERSLGPEPPVYHEKCSD
ncbi:DgyrCDS14763 [Dimorphilus gyrociliatus]|uniref:DgyrCDS14763 n=1 Tax=Dimorphilus gyrociliatus TaxID=2664684 RepID=A0A7I8WER0_9ANNE|nr:DgyrCDS14763 [Dimorphilus gyrociliatus]